MWLPDVDSYFSTLHKSHDEFEDVWELTYQIMGKVCIFIENNEDSGKFLDVCRRYFRPRDTGEGLSDKGDHKL